MYNRESIYTFKFGNSTSITSATIEGKILDCNELFYGCSNLTTTTLDISRLNTSNVTNMCSMFRLCSNLTTLDLSNFDTSNVTNMSYMFYGCVSLTTLNVSNWNISNVNNMTGMFYDCHNLTTIGKVDTASGWQHNPGVYDDMFSNCPAAPKPKWYTA